MMSTTVHASSLRYSRNVYGVPHDFVDEAPSRSSAPSLAPGPCGQLSGNGSNDGNHSPRGPPVASVPAAG
ncbi:hypothetical protein MTO96_001959 [Rhipicephalus appendiculatus]